MYYDDLKNNGHFILKGNFFDIDDNNVIEFHNIFSNPNQEKHTNRKGQILNNIIVIKNFSKYPCLKKFYSKFSIFLKDNNLGNLKFKDIWLQKSNQETYKKNELPFIPHIDKNRSFKMMIYLNDVKKKDGPLHLIKINPEKFENKRQNLSTNYYLNKENHIQDIDTKDFIDCSGERGTSIFFDTNCPHFAGAPENTAKDRLIYRVNFNYIKNII